MFDAMRNLFEALPPLSSVKNSQLAGLLGFLSGGIGLGLYFLSFIDALIPIGIIIAVTFVFGWASFDYTLALLAGATISALYGYFRAETSNAKLAGPETIAVPPTTGTT